MKLKFKQYAGFTLIEMLVTVVVLAVTLVIAVPSFYSLIQNSRTITTTNSILYAFKLARSEAIKRAVSVSVCPTANEDFDACGNDWTKGWIVFVNPDEDSVFANNSIEPLLRSEKIADADYTIEPSPNLRVITFNSAGFAITGNVTFTIQADGCTTDHAREINISTTGRTSVISIDCT